MSKSILAVSLILNLASAAALTYFLSAPDSRSRFAPAAKPEVAAAGSAASTANHRVNTLPAVEGIPDLDTAKGIRTVADALEGLGLSREMARFAVAAVVNKRTTGIRRALLQGVAYGGRLTLAQIEQIRSAQESCQKLLEEAFGSGAGNMIFDTLDTERKYGVSPDKAAILLSIDSDYAYLRSKILNDSTLSEEQRRVILQKLGEERLADMRSTMGAEQYDAYQLQNSAAAQQVKTAIGSIELSDDQVKQLIQQQQKFNDAMQGSSPASARDRYFESQKALYADARQAFGDDAKYFEYLQKNDRLYASLTQDLGTPANLSPDDTFQLAQLQRSLAVDLERIKTDQSLSPSQKADARAQLVSRYGPALNNLLGTSGMEAYRASKWGMWIKRNGTGG